MNEIIDNLRAPYTEVCVKKLIIVGNKGVEVERRAQIDGDYYLNGDDGNQKARHLYMRPLFESGKDEGHKGVCRGLDIDGRNDGWAGNMVQRNRQNTEHQGESERQKL